MFGVVNNYVVYSVCSYDFLIKEVKYWSKNSYKVFERYIKKYWLSDKFHFNIDNFTGIFELVDNSTGEINYGMLLNDRIVCFTDNLSKEEMKVLLNMIDYMVKE